MASEHHAEILEILRCQRRQCFPIDLVVAKGRQIELNAQTLQPRRYVDAVSSAPRSGSSLGGEYPPPLDLPTAPRK